MFIASQPINIALLRSAMFGLVQGYKHDAPTEQKQSPKTKRRKASPHQYCQFTLTEPVPLVGTVYV